MFVGFLVKARLFNADLQFCRFLMVMVYIE